MSGAIRLINPTVFPVRVRMACALIDELIECEMGSWEDWTHAQRNAGEQPEHVTENDDGIFGTVHRVDILKRHPSRFGQYMGTIEMLDHNEVAEVYYGACSGTFQIDRTSEEDQNAPGNVGAKQYRAAVRLCDRLRPILQESTDPAIIDLLRRWSAPAGC